MVETMQTSKKDGHFNESIVNEEILEDMKKNRIDHMKYLPAVSYTHLDVYKRQGLCRRISSRLCKPGGTERTLQTRWTWRCKSKKIPEQCNCLLYTSCQFRW